MSTVELERGWTELSCFSTEQVLRGLVYGEKSRFTLADVVALVSGRHGDEAQRDFVDVLSRGAKHPSTGLQHSFSSLCVRASYLEPLLALVNATADVRINGAPVTKSQWLDAMSTRVTPESRAITCTLFEQAVDLIDPFAQKVMAFALEHQPGHIHIDQLMARGGRATSLMAEALLNRRLASDTAASRAQAPSAPRRRHGI